MKAIWNWIEKLALGCLGILFKILHKEMTPQAEQSFMQFVKFCFVGLSNTVISYVLYAVSLMIIQKLELFPRWDYIIAQVIQFVLSVAWSFYWNNRMVFVKEEGKQRNLWFTLIKTYISYSFTGLILSSVLLFFWVDMLHMSEYIAPIVNLIITVPLNFVINKFWAFRSK